VGLPRHQLTLSPAPKPPCLTLGCTAAWAYPGEEICFHSFDSRLGAEREITFRNLVFQLRPPPDCWKSYPESSSFFMLCSLTSLPLPSAIPSSLAHPLVVKHSHQQNLVISLSVGPAPQLTETEENYTGLGQICKFKPPSFVSPNGMSRSQHSLKEGNTMWFPETGRDWSQWPRRSHLFPCSSFLSMLPSCCHTSKFRL